jgi:protein-S-isoprenylcysteine O-methyltransferase Ste14
MTTPDDTAGVIAPPPLLALGVIVLGLLLDWLAPAYLLSLMLSLTARITILVTDGIFGRLRNPMYVGGILFLAGLAIALASDWMLVLTILLVPVIHYGVVRREERYLAARFGEPYHAYMTRVPRYGWPF